MGHMQRQQCGRQAEGPAKDQLPRRSDPQGHKNPGQYCPQWPKPTDHAAPPIRMRSDVGDVSVQPRCPIDIRQRHRQGHQQTDHPQYHQASLHGCIDRSRSRRSGQVRVCCTGTGHSPICAQRLSCHGPRAPLPFHVPKYPRRRHLEPVARPSRAKGETKGSRVSAQFQTRPNPRATLAREGPRTPHPNS